MKAFSWTREWGKMANHHGLFQLSHWQQIHALGKHAEGGQLTSLGCFRDNFLLRLCWHKITETLHQKISSGIYRSQYTHGTKLTSRTSVERTCMVLWPWLVVRCSLKSVYHSLPYYWTGERDYNGISSVEIKAGRDHSPGITAEKTDPTWGN